MEAPVVFGASPADPPLSGGAPAFSLFPKKSFSSSPQSSPLLQRAAARVTGSRLFWVVFVAVAFALPLVRSVRRALPPAPPVLGSFPAFALVDQAGHPVREADLRGYFVVVEFTTAAALAEGARLSRGSSGACANTGEAVHLVSFVDTTGSSLAGPTLAALAKGAGAGAWRWTLAGGDVRPLEAATLKALRAPEGGTLRAVFSSSTRAAVCAASARRPPTRSTSVARHRTPRNMEDSNEFSPEASYDPPPAP